MPTITIPAKHAEALKEAAKGRVAYTPPTITRTRLVEAAIKSMKADCPHLFREQEDGSVAPRISVK